MTPSAADAADLCRSDAGLSLEAPIPDVLLMAEGMGIHVYVIDLPGGEIEGACLTERGETFIFVAAYQRDGKRFHPTRQRFTVAHEMGHHRLGHGTVLDATVGEGGRPEGQDAEEDEADAFASALLMPVAAIEAWMVTAQIQAVRNLDEFINFAAHFGVSGPAAFRRLREEGLFSSEATRAAIGSSVHDGEANWKRKRRRQLAYGDRLQQLYAEDGTYVPSALRDRVDHLLAFDVLSHEKASNLLDGRATPEAGR